MKKYILSSIIFISGSAIILGWVYDFEFLLNLNTSMPTVKPTTAVSMMMIAIMSMFIISDCVKESKIKQLILTTMSCWLFLIMILVMFSVLILGDYIGFENIFYDRIEMYFVNSSSKNYMPSVITIMGIVTNAAGGLVYIFNSVKVIKRIKIIGIINILIGMIAVTGYITTLPFLYYFVENYSPGMSIITATLFVLQGINLINISRQLKKCKCK